MNMSITLLRRELLVKEGNQKTLQESIQSTNVEQDKRKHKLKGLDREVKDLLLSIQLLESCSD